MPFTDERLSKKRIDDLINKYFVTEYTESYIEVGEEKTFMPGYYSEYEERIKNFKVYDDDVLIATYAKAGTTWTQEMVWLIANNADFEKAKSPLEDRFPFIEFCTIFNIKKMDKDMDSKTPASFSDSLNYANNAPRPRLLKTHLAYSLLPQEIQNGSKSPKIIYVMRNPKDLCVSYYHHGRLLHCWLMPFPDFLDVFLSGKILYGSYWKHILGYWQRRNQSNILIITYEEMKENLAAVIRKVAKFLEKELTDEQIDKMLNHLSFESMKKNPFCNYESYVEQRRQRKIPTEGTFLRSGTVGNYKTIMTDEDSKRMEAWSRKNVENTGFAEKYKHYI